MKNFGFGCMRLPMLGAEVDIPQFTAMVDRFMEAGFTYFDTAHVYIGGQSETALKTCLTSRYPRESYILTNKLSTSNFETEAEILPLFQSQLEACGVDYFDYYLMHAQNAELYEKYLACGGYRISSELKAAGKVRHVGISFHDKAAVLDRILSEQPCIEAVQIQFNYVDYDDANVESGKCLEVCRRHHKPVIVMEPVKGGGLSSLVEEAGAVLDALGGGSRASYAIRYAASFDGVMMVLSGMSTLGQVEDNVRFMADFKPLTEAEYAAIARVKEILSAQGLIPCTACRYCTEGCPAGIDIPGLFGCLNAAKQFLDDSSRQHYGYLTSKGGKAADCLKCGRCEAACPQHLGIRELLEEVSAAFDR